MVINLNRTLRHVLMLVVVCLVMTMEPSALGCITRERQALLDIKAGLVDSYGFLSSWGSEDHKRDCCKWRGITCSNRTGHVTVLDIFFSAPQMSMRGKMSHSLFVLRHLTYLDLSNIDFGGSPFPNNGSLSKLRHLDLSFANFGGTIAYLLGNLSSLQFLDLRLANFSDIGDVEWLSRLSSLRLLDLSYNRLTKPSKWLQVANSLPFLTTLLLTRCFSGYDDIPPTLSPINSSSSLTLLDLSLNGLVIPSIHPWLSNISQNLYSLDFSSNILQPSALSDFQNMINLVNLVLSNTTLEGNIPKSFGNMSQLQMLDLSNNNFSINLPELIQNLSGCTHKSLLSLLLGNNQITGSLPDLTRFSSLYELNLGNNRLHGTLEKSIGRLSNLEILDLGWNSLSGFISEEHFSSMSNLTDLVLSGNSFTWNISVNWIPPFVLHSIELQSCNMGPHFPIWLQSQSDYTRLDISSNGISGSVPKWFWDLSLEFLYLNISYNNLSGRVPKLSLGLIMFDIVVDVSFNCFNGPLPALRISSESIAQDVVVTYKSPEGGTFYGTLIYLDLSNNQISGVIPDHFLQVQDIVFLNLANNNLSGQIPTSIGLLWKLHTVNLQNNVLSGQLPLSLKNCTRLRLLDLRGNKLSGEIPTWIGESLSSLQFLSLKSNHFHGCIPLPLCRLTNVQILDLSLNNLNGTVPHCLQNLTAMVEGNTKRTIAFDYYWSPLGHMLDFPIGYFYIAEALVLWKGRNYVSDRNLGQFRIIDLSSNKIQGEIPKELSSLSKLKQLNLSNNVLYGTIPREIDGLKQLESLDLSRNQLSGRIPDSLASLTFMSTLNLSYNKLSGRIPSSTQLQSFDASAFTGNLALCGLPLTQTCPGDETNQIPKPTDDSQDEEDGDEFVKWLYVGMGLGFIVSFWGVSSALLLKRSWRHAYFKLIDKSADWIHVRMVVQWRRLCRKFQI